MFDQGSHTALVETILHLEQTNTYWPSGMFPECYFPLTQNENTVSCHFNKGAEAQTQTNKSYHKFQGKQWPRR